MSTMRETLQGIVAESDVNAAALDSVMAHAAGRIRDVETWPNSPTKGALRDQLQRLQSAYDKAKAAAAKTSALAARVIGTDPGDGPAPTPTPPATLHWSTGDW